MTPTASRGAVFKHATPPVGVYGKLDQFRGTGDVAFRTGLFSELPVNGRLAGPDPHLSLGADEATSPLKRLETTQQDSHEHHPDEERL